MAESTEPGIDTGTPTEDAPSETPEMGMGFADDTLLGDSSSDGHSEDDAEAGPQSAEADAEQQSHATSRHRPSTETKDEVDSQEAGMRQADYTRSKQDLARREEALDEERRQWYAEREADLRTREQPVAEQEYGDPVSRVVAQYGLDSENERGLRAVKDVTDGQLEPVYEALKKVEQLEERLNRASAVTDQLSDAQMQSVKDRVLKQAKEAVRTYGEADVQSALAFVQKNLDDVNGRTGDPYTVSELVAMFHQHSAAEAGSARRQASTQRAKAKSRVSTVGSGGPSSNGIGAWSEDKAIAAIEETM